MALRLRHARAEAYDEEPRVGMETQMSASSPAWALGMDALVPLVCTAPRADEPYNTLPVLAPSTHRRENDASMMVVDSTRLVHLLVYRHGYLCQIRRRGRRCRWSRRSLTRLGGAVRAYLGSMRSFGWVALVTASRCPGATGRFLSMP